MKLRDLDLLLRNKLNDANQNQNVSFFLLQSFCGYKDKLDIINHQYDEIDNYLDIEKALEEYLNGKPLSKITGKCMFYGLEFQVNKNVFSPRLETELLVEIACKKINKCLSNKILNVADICCGTGIIGLSIKNEFKNKIKMYLSDINEAAYFNTLENANKLNLDVTVNISPNLEYYYKSNIILDVIISNPPYIAINDLNIGNNVNKFDPLTALYCGDNGLIVYKTILQQSLRVLNQDKFLIVFEIGFNQAEILSDYILEIYKDVKIEVIKDYSNLDRILVISKNW